MPLDTTKRLLFADPKKITESVLENRLPKNLSIQVKKATEGFYLQLNEHYSIKDVFLPYWIADIVLNNSRYPSILNKLNKFEEDYAQAQKLSPHEVNILEQVFQVSSPYNQFFAGIGIIEHSGAEGINEFSKMRQMLEEMRIGEPNNVFSLVEKDLPTARRIYSILIRNKSREIRLFNSSTVVPNFDTVVSLTNPKNQKLTNHYGTLTSKGEIINEYIKSLDLEEIKDGLNKDNPNAHAMSYLTYTVEKNKSTVNTSLKKLKKDSPLAKSIESSLRLASLNKNTLKSAYDNSPSVFEIEDLVEAKTLEANKSLKFAEMLTRKNLIPDILSKSYDYKRIQVLG